MSKAKSGSWKRWALRNPEKAQARADRRYAAVRARREAAAAEKVAELMAVGFIRIAEYPDYLIDASGAIYSTRGRRVMRIAPGTKPRGYQFVGLGNGAGTKYKMVHRLVRS